MAVIAVVGASGNIGSRVVARLVAQGSDVRAVSRDPGEVPDGVEAVAADLTDPDRAREALEAATGVYLTPPEAGEDPLRTETTVARNVIDAAAALGVEHLVLHTAVHADRGTPGRASWTTRRPLRRRSRARASATRSCGRRGSCRTSGPRASTSSRLS